MALGGGTEVGRVFTSLGFKVDDRDATTYDRLVAKLRRDSSKDITAHAKVDADTTGVRHYEDAVKRAGKSNDDLIRGTGRVRSSFGTLAVGGAAVGGAVVGLGLLAKGISTVNSQYENSELIGKRTVNVIKSTGGAAGISAKQVEDLATAISRKSGIDDEAIQSGENLLLTFTNVRNEVGKGNDIFTQATGTIADMSAALGQDTSSSAIQLGKALNDPIKGVTALSRVGVSFTEQQKEQIATLVKSGDTVKAQKVILGELSKEFGGAAAAGNTGTKQLSVSFGNLEESIGGALAPAIGGASQDLSTFINQIEDGTGAGGRFADTASNVAGVVKGALSGAFSFAGRVIGGVEDIIKDNRKTIDSIGSTVADVAGQVVRAASKIAGAFSDTFGSGSGTGRDIKQIVSALLSVYNVILKVEAAVVKRALPGIIQAFQGLARIIRGVIKVISGILTGDFGKAWDGVKDIFSGAVKSLGGLIRAGTAPIRAAAAAIGKAIGGAFSSAWDGITSTATGFVNKIIDIINVIPGVKIGHVGSSKKANVGSLGLTGASSGGYQGASTGGKPRSVQALAEGGLVTAPIAIMGEEAPTHPEWVLPTNPAYRPRAISLWMAAAKDLGIPGFALGGLLDPGKAVSFIGSLPGKAANAAGDIARKVTGQLPGNPGGVIAGAFDYALDKAKDYIGDKAGSVWDAAKSAVGIGGGGGGAGVGGLVPQVLAALAWARSHGWHGQVNSGLRSTAKQQYLWDHAAQLGLVRGVSVAAPGTSEHERGRAVDVSDVPGFQRAMATAPANARLLWRGSSDPVHFSVSGHARGGKIGMRGLMGGTPLGSILGTMLPGGGFGFAAGGKKAAKKAPKPILSAKENSGIRRSVNRGERGISTYEGAIQDGEKLYSQMDRRFGLTDEEYLIENDDGSTTVDQDAVTIRRVELGSLMRQREKIRAKILAYRKALRSLMKAIRAAIKTLQTALAAAKGKARQKERGGYRDAIDAYQTRLGDLKGTYKDLGFDVSDNDIDLQELRNEDAAVNGTKATAADPADAPDPPDTTTDTPEPSTGSDTPTDTSTPADAAPTAEQLAQATAQAFAAFSSNRADLFSSFGSNFQAGGNPGEAGQAAGARYFGATGAAQGMESGAYSPISQAGGEIPANGLTVVNNYAAPPPDPHTWSKDLQYELSTL